MQFQDHQNDQNSTSLKLLNQTCAVLGEFEPPARSVSADGRSEVAQCGEVSETVDAPPLLAKALEGTPPSNTVPLNYNPKTFKALRYGIDSLYVSYPGVIAEDWDKKLAKLKEQAQSEDETQQALAQVVIGQHIFEVKDKGKGRFSYVLVDNSFYLQASNGKSKALPMAYVQISSEYLAHVGVEQAEKSLQFIVKTLGLVHEPANISRVDLFVDLCADLAMDSFDPLQSWITRTQSIDLHYRYNKFSGWSFGMGGEIGARLYDKTLEVEKKSKKFYLHDFWKAEGWVGQQTVWRMEFEAKREVLKQLGIYKMSNLLELQSALWLYLTQDWLRLAIPSPTDSNQTRWLNHPLWDDISQVFNNDKEQQKLKRFSSARVPEDERLFVHGLGGITSFMAREGIEDLGEGIGEYLHQAQDFHEKRAIILGTGMNEYVTKKVKSKNRRFNSINNRQDNFSDKHQVIESARAYREHSEGDQ
ncbi:hypothetical protein [Methylotenera versatilis]|uniref:Replication initiation factor n=1 Tax=Methylotenera versatilis (strain 301) TaxID=666681 RepID=D7DL95_METV0|nr:hypothetical protein [Methylotenera versatilis]ADI30566.1 conserved hypothetical protein [Methylotenera versatilis 301]